MHFRAVDPDRSQRTPHIGGATPSKIWEGRFFNERFIYLGCVFALFSMAVALRWHNIGYRSLWLDELAQVTVARADGVTFLAGVRAHTAAAPLDYAGTKLMLTLLGFSTESARLWQFLMGLTTIFFAERVAFEMTGSRRAAIAAIVLCIPSAFLVYYSQEARFYALAAATSVAATWAYSRVDRLRRWRDWGLFTFASVVAIYTHYFYALLFAVFALWLVLAEFLRWTRTPTARAVVTCLRRLAPLAVVTSLVGLAFLPWYLFAARYNLALPYIYAPVPDLTPDRLSRLLLSLLAAAPRLAPAGGDLVTDWILTIGVICLAAAGVVRYAFRRPLLVGAVTTYMVLLIPLVWTANQRAGYVVSERQFITLLPLLLIMAGAGVAAVMDAAVVSAGRVFRPCRQGRPAVWAQIVLAGTLAVVFVAASYPPLHRIWSGGFRPSEDWRGASEFVESEACPAGHIYTNVPGSFGYGVAVYAPNLIPRLVYLQEHPQQEWLVDVLRRYPITVNDMIVVFRDRPGVYVPGQGTIEIVSNYLAGLGFAYREFTPRIRVFASKVGCPLS